MKKILLGAVLVLLIAGCQSSPVSPAAVALASCDQFAAALHTVSQPDIFAKLNDSTVALVTETRDAVQPFCTGPAPDVNATVTSIAIDAGTKVLLAVAASIGVQ